LFSDVRQDTLARIRMVEAVLIASGKHYHRVGGASGLVLGLIPAASQRRMVSSCAAGLMGLG
jgi:hypothetical protein